MYTVAAFYKFTPLPRYADYCKPLAKLGCANGVVGSILLAEEGINGTIGGTRGGVDTVLDALRALPGCADLEHKESQSSGAPFKRLKVRLKKEIVTMGVPVDAASDAGVYVHPRDWNDLLDDPEVVLVDTRNAYETGIGVFDGAVDPRIESFGDFPAWLDDFASKTDKPKIAMYCTGGIRCEKSTAYAKNLGFREIYHLKGGILKYLEEVPEAESRWTGECYVFDRRVAVGHGLEQGRYAACGACGLPVDAEDKAHPAYEEGVCCPHCVDRFSEGDRERFRERQRQYRRRSAERKTAHGAE